MGLPLYLLIWFFIGCAFLLVISFPIYGKVQLRFDKDKKDPRNKRAKILLSAAMAVCFVLYMLSFDFVAFAGAASREWHVILLFNAVLLVSLSVFDAIVIDLLILVYWKPAFLRIPKDGPTLEYMKRHVKAQFTVGLIPVAILALAGALISAFLF